MRWLRPRLFWILALVALAGLPMLALLALRLGFATPLVNLALKRELGNIFNGEVRFGSFRSDLFSYAEIDDLLVLTSKSQVASEARLPVLTAGSIRLNYDGWQLLRGHRKLEDAVELLSIRTLRVFLLRDTQGRWNLRDMLKLPRGARARTEGPASPSKLPMLATRVVLGDSVVVFNDERRDFQSTVENVEGTLDARAFPLVAFSLSGRTEDKKEDNLSFAGEWNAEEESLYARADVDLVPLKTYLNYALPEGGLQFLGGVASLSVRVRQAAQDPDFDFSGRAEVHDGSLAIPGVAEPLRGLEGEVLFGDDRFQVNGVTAAFLGSTWKARGELSGLKKPVLNLVLENPAVALSPLSQQIRGLKALSLSGTAALSLTMTGSVTDPDATGSLEAPDIDLAGIHMTGVDARLSLNKKGLKVSSFQGRLWDGAVQGSADIVFPGAHGPSSQGSIRGQLQAAGVDLSLVRYKGVEYLPITGTARLDASIQGPLRRPKVEARLNCPASYFSAHAMGALDLGLDTEGRSLFLTLGTWRGGLNARVGFSFEKQAEFVDSLVRMKDFPVDDLMRAISVSHDTALITPALRSRMEAQARLYSGKISAELRLSGPVRRPDLSLRVSKAEGRLLTGQGLLKTRDSSGLLFNISGLLRFNRDGLYFGDGKEPFRLRLPGSGHPVEARLLGSLPVRSGQAEDKVGLDLQLSADLGLLDQLDLFRQTKGKGEMDLRLHGTMDSLAASGWLQVKDFSSNMQRYFPALKNGEAEILVKDQQVTVENLSFESAGLFQAEGKLDFVNGFKPWGSLEAHTDTEQGLYLEDFGYGNLKVILDPLIFNFKGPAGLQVLGRARLHDSTIAFGKPRESGPVGQESALASYPLVFDLRAALDENVWLKKIEGGVDFSFNPIDVLNQTISSMKETLLSPGFEFLFKPTETDFQIKGSPPLLQVTGELGIERGTLTFMDNEFKLEQRGEANVVRFKGQEKIRADINAQATAQIRYVRELQGGKMDPRTVLVTVTIRPFTEDELAAAHLENSLLNYDLDSFSSDPPFSPDPQIDQAAILSLLVIGDPFTQSAQDASSNGPSQSQGSMQLLSAEAGKVISSVMRKTINRYAKFLGNNQIVDYVRLSPRIGYQGSNSSSNSGPTVAQNNGQTGLTQQVQQDSVSWSWLFELGRNLGKDFFVSSQVLYFGQSDVDSVVAQSNSSTQTYVNPWGTRVVGEYRLNSTRTLEASYGHSVDENLQPVAYSPDTVDRVSLLLRNSVPMDNYSPRQARQRHREALAGKELKQ